MTPEEYYAQYRSALPDAGEEVGPPTTLALREENIHPGKLQRLVSLAPRSVLLGLIQSWYPGATAMGLDELKARARKWENEFEGLQREVLQQNRRMLEMAQNNDRVFSELKRQEGRVECLQNDLTRSRNTERTLEERIVRLQRELAILQQQNQNLQRARQRLRRIERSFSWRITALWRLPGSKLRRLASGLPLRKLRTALRVFRHRGPAGVMEVLREKQARNTSAPTEATASQLYRLQRTLTPLEFTPADQPLLSILVLADGRHPHTQTCLASLLDGEIGPAYEVLLVDTTDDGAAAQAFHLHQGLRFVSRPGAKNGPALLRDLAKGLTTDCLLLLENHGRLSPGSVDALYAEFAGSCALAAPKLLSRGGRVLDAGGVIYSDGVIARFGVDSPAMAPAVRYRREAGFCSLNGAMLRREALTELSATQTWNCPDYQLADLAMQLRKAGYGVVYQPGAELVLDLPSGAVADIDFTEGEQARFADTWEDALAGLPDPQTPLQLAKDGLKRKRILIIDAVIPTPDQDSGSLRMVYMLNILKDLDCQVTLAPSTLEDIEPYGEDLRRSGIEVLCRPNYDNLENHLKRHGGEIDVAILSRLTVADRFLPLVRRHAPQARVVYDTVDLHFLREERQAELENNAELREAAKATRKLETGFIRDSDLTYVVSPYEQELLAREVPGSRIEVLSNIHRTEPTQTPIEQRRDIIFIGGFRHPPNVDAMLWFVNEVLPLVREQLSDFRLFIIGSLVTPEIQALAGDDVVVTGFVKDVKPYYERARLSVSPLRYGAGVKGKVNMSMAYGVPVVATGISVEGMSLTPGHDVLVADDPQGFADAVLRLYREPEVWHGLARHGLENIEQHFSERAAARVLQSTLLNDA